MLDDASLLVAYTVKRDASAFRRLLEGHIDFVYAAALRQTSDPHLADDITQAVFLLLSQKARSLKPGILLKGWLFNATRYAAANALRAQQRRKIHEQEAAAMRPSTVAGFSPSPFSSDASVPDQAQSHFDAALASLSESDRNALLVRFFEDQPFSCVGQRLGISEYAAQKRVSRALDRVRRYLLRKDIAADSLTVPGLLILCAGQSAPSHLLSAAFTAIEGAAQGAVSSSTVSIAKGASKMLMRSHAKLVALKTTVLLASGSVALAVAVEAPRLSSPAAPPPANPRVILADQAPTADSDTQLVYEACRQCMLSIMDAHDHNDLKAILDLCYFSPQMDPRMVEMIKFEIQDDLVRYHLRKVAFDHFGGRAQLLNVHGEGVVNILNDVLARCNPSSAHMTGDSVAITPDSYLAKPFGLWNGSLYFKNIAGDWKLDIDRSFRFQWQATPRNPIAGQTELQVYCAETQVVDRMYYSVADGIEKGTITDLVQAQTQINTAMKDVWDKFSNLRSDSYPR